MQTKAFKLFDLGSVPLWMDASFVVLAILWLSSLMQGPTTLHYFTVGMVVFVGLILSILLHELGHSLAAAYLGTGTSYVEFTGLGGLCHYDSALPEQPVRRIAISLAGPLLNLIIWLVLRDVATLPVVQGNWLESGVVHWLAAMNLAILIFNLLPSFPLDGGVSLSVALKPVVGFIWSRRIVGWLGMVVVALCVLDAVRDGLWTWMLAFSLFGANREELKRAGSWPWK